MTVPTFLGSADDTDASIADDGIERSDDGPALGLPPIERALGFILDEEDEEKVAKHVIKLREDQEPAMSRRRAVWKRNRWWREGRRFVRLEKKENSNLWEAKLPYGMGSAPPVPNKTDRICRRLTNTLLVDKPFPDCEPGDDSNEARDAAEFSTRYLSVKGSPAELNMNRILRKGSDKAQTYGSAFGWVTMDPTRGGHRPRRMLAHLAAPHKDAALVDPTSGLQASERDLAERFVRSDGYLTDDPSDADLQWMPAPKVRTLTGLQLVMLPETATGLDDAIGVVITDTTSLGDLKKMFPDRFEGPKALSKDQIEAICQWRPPHVEDILPPYTKIPDDQKYTEGDREGEFKDSQLVVVSTIYYESCAEYPYGCYAVIGGDSKVLHKQKWSALVPANNGAQETMTEECLEIPVGQCRCLDDDVNDDAYGIGISEHLGPADEIRASALGFELEHMFRSANPHTFLPVGSIVQPKQLQLRSGEPIYTNPQGKPEVEDVPPLSSTVPALRVEMGEEIDDESGLQQAAQGVENPTVKSGIHAQTIVQEALKAVMGMKDNLGDYYIALNRIILQLSRAYCEVPDLLSYVGKDGEYKAQEWSRQDFRNTKVVSIAKGSFTMHTLLAKQEMANNAFDRKVIDADEYTDLVTGGVSPVLGVQDNPHLLRIRRQLDQFKKGPTKEWLTASAAQQQTAQQVAAQAGAMIPGQGLEAMPGAPVAHAAPVPPPPPGPFSDALPVDDLPEAAKIRFRQLSRAMAESRFATHPQPWRDLFTAEYMKAKNAAGVMTVAEVQQAKAQEQAAAQQVAAQQLAAQQQAAAGEEARKNEELELRRAEVGASVRQAEAASRPSAAEGPKRVNFLRDEMTGAVTGADVVPGGGGAA